jgi:predicted Rossmann-fold nucleotide-binding protein
MKSICIFCGAGKARNPVYNDRARELGNLIAERNLKLVYGGASVGLMGTVADGVLEKGGEVYGILPDFLFKNEVGHTGIQKL